MAFAAGQTLTAAGLNSLTGFSRYTNNGIGLPTIAAAGNGIVPFNNPTDTSPYVTASGANNISFTINLSGPCTFAAGVRWKTDAAIVAGGDWYFRAIRTSGTAVELVGDIEKASVAYGANTFFVKNIGATRYMNAGDVIQFQLSNGTNQTSTLASAGEVIFCSFKREGS